VVSVINDIIKTFSILQYQDDFSAANFDLSKIGNQVKTFCLIQYFKNVGRMEAILLGKVCEKMNVLLLFVLSRNR
jgi:hypothetical protein